MTLMSVAKDLQETFGHWGDHPEFPVADWQYEVGNGDTRLGYWEWVAARLGLVEV